MLQNLTPAGSGAARMRATFSAVLAFLFFVLLVIFKSPFLLVLTTIFAVFTATPLIIVSLCKPPLVIASDHIFLKMMRKRQIPFERIDNVLHNEESQFIQIKLVSSDVIKIPFYLLDNPLNVTETIQKRLFSVIFDTHGR